MHICQSCGMPMNKELYGKNNDGRENTDYCRYCFPEGAFNNPDETFEEMVETCIPFMMKEGYTEAESRNYLIKTLKNLKRWA